MIKSELIMLLSQRLPNITEKKIHDATNLILQELANHLISGNRIEIRGFGSFSLRLRAPRQAYNPKNQKKTTTKAKLIPHFKAGRTLKIGIQKNQKTHPIQQG